MAVNSKRVDFLITDKAFQPIAAVEYQGSGHGNDKKTQERNKIKQDAIIGAKLRFYEIHHETKDDNLKQVLKALNQI